MLALGWAHPLVLHIVLSWTSRAMMPVLAVSGSCSKDDVLFSGDYSVFFVVYIYISQYTYPGFFARVSQFRFLAWQAVN